MKERTLKLQIMVPIAIDDGFLRRFACRLALDCFHSPVEIVQTAHDGFQHRHDLIVLLIIRCVRRRWRTFLQLNGRRFFGSLERTREHPEIGSDIIVQCRWKISSDYDGNSPRWEKQGARGSIEIKKTGQRGLASMQMKQERT